MSPLAELVARAQGGDRVAFDGVVRRCQDAAVAYALSLTGNVHDAEDSAQDAFVTAYRNLKSLREPAAFPGWLRRIVRSHCQRVMSGRTDTSVEVDAEVMAAPPHAQPDATLERDEQHRMLHAIIDDLPPALRETVLLFYIGDRSHADIADFLGSPVNTVKSRLHAARTQLRENMITMAEEELDGLRPSRDERFDANVRALLDAAYKGQADSVQRLVSEQPSIVGSSDTHDKTALHWAAEADRAAGARVLLEAGADPDAITSWGMTPLQWAANMGSRDVGDVLIAHGETIDLWCAAGLGMTQEVEQILNAADRTHSPSIVCIDRLEGRYRPTSGSVDNSAAINDAFYIACRNGHVGAATALLEAGADIDHRGYWGATPMHWASFNGHRAIVELLLRNAADTTIIDEKWKSTAFDWAEVSEKSEIAELLRRATK